MRRLALLPVLAVMACSAVEPTRENAATLGPAPIPNRVADRRAAGFTPKKDGGIAGGATYVAAQLLTAFAGRR